MSTAAHKCAHMPLQIPMLNKRSATRKVHNTFTAIVKQTLKQLAKRKTIKACRIQCYVLLEHLHVHTSQTQKVYVYIFSENKTSPCNLQRVHLTYGCFFFSRLLNDT